MPDQSYPLLLFPEPTVADRNSRGGGGSSFRTPAIGRQRTRIAPKLATLRQAFDAERLRLQEVAPAQNPELVLVLETIGSVERFANAVRRVAGFEWLAEWTEDEIAADDDFYVEDKPEKALSGRLFLLATNEQALNQLQSLWNRYEKDPTAKFDRGLTPFRDVFMQLRDIRPWSVQDRIGNDIRAYWEDCLHTDLDPVRFEVEAWYYASVAKNAAVEIELGALVAHLDGQILKRALIPEIAYHGFLVAVPRNAIARIVAGELPELVLSDRVMFFRPKAQSMAITPPESELTSLDAVPVTGEGPPLVALLDGLPLQNHPLLAGRMTVDDPDGWEANYEAKDRVHGTAMASLILHGEIGAGESPLSRSLYVRPILRPNPTDTFNPRRREQTPEDVLLLDLVHRSLKRICEGEVGQAAAAPTVRVVNLSVCDERRVFDRELSPWARLLDWLAFKYKILFVVSAGNCADRLSLPTPANSLSGLAQDARENLAIDALVAAAPNRRLLSPAEAINVLTIGAVHMDRSTPVAAPNRFDLFASGNISPISRIGHGFRRAIKPDVLVPGGRALYREQLGHGDPHTVVELIDAHAAPGLRVAVPPLTGEGLNSTTYSRGTSNAAALASRAAAKVYEVLEAMREDSPDLLPEKFDAVLLKALLAHGATWSDLSTRLLARRGDLTDYTATKDFLMRWLGHGVIDMERALACTDERATLLGVGELGDGEALVFHAPLPPSLAGKALWRRLTLTLAWLSPTNPFHQSYRRARLWITPPHDKLQVKRVNSVHDKAAQRGTLQHESLEGDGAVAFVDGSALECKVNCAADAGELIGKVPFALCLTVEVAPGVGIPVYQEIRARIAPLVGVKPAVV